MSLSMFPCVCSTSVIGEASCTSFLSTVQAIICSVCTRMRSTQLASEKNRCLLNFKVFSCVFDGFWWRAVQASPRIPQMIRDVPVGFFTISKSGIGVSFACRGETRTDPERNPSSQYPETPLLGCKAGLITICRSVCVYQPLHFVTERPPLNFNASNF